MKSFFKCLQALEKEILSHWKRTKFDLKVFPQLSSQILSTYDLHRSFDPQELLNMIIKKNNHPDIHSYDLNFTENVHFTLIKNSHFVIDFYSWFDHTEIHAHNFSGTFQVMSGDFSQTTYKFSKEKSGKNWAVGPLVIKKREVLDLGQITPIIPTEKFIHQVFHFKKPSVSLCVRNPTTLKPYFSYFYPGLRLTDITFKRPEFLRIKSFAQLGEIGLITHELCQNLIEGLTPSRLIYDYMKGLNSFNLQNNDKLMLEKAIQEKFMKDINLDLKNIRQKNLIHTTKLELGGR